MMNATVTQTQTVIRFPVLLVLIRWEPESVQRQAEWLEWPGAWRQHRSQDR